MTGSGEAAYDVLCISYLASAQLLWVDAYPSANYGAEVTVMEQSLAADGAIAAVMLASMGHRAVLAANSVAYDAAGQGLLELLERLSVHYLSASVAARAASPQIAVISDRAGSRTWFPYLPAVNQELLALDLSCMKSCRLVYVDYYDVIKTAAERVV